MIGPRGILSKLCFGERENLSNENVVARAGIDDEACRTSVDNRVQVSGVKRLRSATLERDVKGQRHFFCGRHLPARFSFRE